MAVPSTTFQSTTLSSWRASVSRGGIHTSIVIHLKLTPALSDQLDSALAPAHRPAQIRGPSVPARHGFPDLDDQLDSSTHGISDNTPQPATSTLEPGVNPGGETFGEYGTAGGAVSAVIFLAATGGMARTTSRPKVIEPNTTATVRRVMGAHAP
jgi:hypothetical protein